MTQTTDRLAAASRAPFLHIPMPWVFVIAFLIGVALQALVPVGIGTASVSLGLRLLGVVLFGAGAVLAGWALTVFHRASTTTTPGDASDRLVTTGPYRLTRNPMYVGLILAYLGEPGMLMQAWPLLPLLLTLIHVNRFVLPVEEASLGAVGSEYETYRAQIGRWI